MPSLSPRHVTAGDVGVQPKPVRCWCWCWWRWRYRCWGCCCCCCCCWCWCCYRDHNGEVQILLPTRARIQWCRADRSGSGRARVHAEARDAAAAVGRHLAVRNEGEVCQGSWEGTGDERKAKRPKRRRNCRINISLFSMLLEMAQETAGMAYGSGGYRCLLIQHATRRCNGRLSVLLRL